MSVIIETPITFTTLKDVQPGLVVDPIFLDRLKSHSRANIRKFVSNCAAKWNLEKPFVDVACGYRTNQPEAMRPHNGVIDPLYIAFDQTLNFDRLPEANAMPNLVADATNIPLPNASVGTVLCTEVLEHVPDDSIVIAEMFRILKRDGRLILTVPGIDVPKHEKPPYQIDYRRYNLDDLKRLLLKFKFKDVKTEEKFLDRKQINLLLTARKV